MDARPPSLTVAICTHRRPVFLAGALESLARQDTSSDSFSVLVVDNADDPATKSVAEKFGANYLLELQTGLSHARNRALEVVNTDWILYFDDDGVAYPNLLNRLSAAIRAEPAAVAIGGRYEHLIPQNAPTWLLHHYQSGHRPSPSLKLTELSEDQYLCGGIMAFRVMALRKVGGFDTGLGMSGDTVAYGEDDAIQDALRDAGYPIHYEPEMVMDHHVQAHKHSIRSRIIMARAHGYGAGRISKSTHSRSWLLGRWVRVAALTVPYEIGRVLFKPRYKWQNGVVSVLTKLAHAQGKYRGAKPRD